MRKLICYISGFMKDNLLRCQTQELFRSSSSSGVNYEESHSAESTRDFLHKRQIVLKELRESFYHRFSRE